MLPHRKYYNSTSFFDLLLNIALILFLMFAIAFMQIKPESQKADIETKAEYIITVTWPDNNRDDVDTWLQDPIGAVAYYRNQETGLMHIDRDDRGDIADWVKTSNGKMIIIPYNQEITSIRGFIEGEWILNIHMYVKRSQGPTPVIIKIEKLNPRVKLIFLTTINLTYDKEEVTVLRFEMTKNGEILSTNHLPANLIQYQADMEAIP